MVGAAAVPADLRAAALRLLAAEQRRDPVFARTLEQALATDAPLALRQTALDLLLPEQPARLAEEADRILQQRTLPEKQQAVALLAEAGQPQTDAILTRLVDALVAGRLESELALDVVEAVTARAANAALTAKLQPYLQSPEAAAGKALLTGGNVVRGREFVTGHLAANCTACHTVESGGGSEVGPNLRAIGSQRDAAYLLESLLKPSAQIATGYGIVNLTLKDGTEITGTLAKETPQVVTVRLFDGRQRIMPRSEIERQTPPVSVMPPMEGILKPRELRDVVAFLVSLKGGRAVRSEPDGGG
jgi:putative heme-binding domain-containing protein